MELIIGPLICQGCRELVVYGDEPTIHRGKKNPEQYQIVLRRGFYDNDHEPHRCPHVERVRVA